MSCDVCCIQGFFDLLALMVQYPIFGAVVLCLVILGVGAFLYQSWPGHDVPAPWNPPGPAIEVEAPAPAAEIEVRVSVKRD